jgi:hypothetical protein
MFGRDPDFDPYKPASATGKEPLRSFNIFLGPMAVTAQ